MPTANAEEQITRRLLTAIEGDATVSQRGLSVDIGIAVGSVNWYLNRCLGRGLIKLQNAPVKRYLYYLTPKGFEEKSRLTAKFLQRSLQLYRLGRQECSEFIHQCVVEGKTQIFLAGDGDLAEIAYLSCVGSSVEIKAVVDGTSQRSACVGVPIYSTLSAAMAETGGMRPNAILLTDLGRPRRCYASISKQASAAGIPPAAIYIPRMLNFTPAYDEQ